MSAGGGVAVSVSRRAVAESALVAGLLGVIAVRQGFGVAGAAVAAAAVVVVALASATAHEWGHVVAARRQGLRVLALRLEGLLGGAVERERSDSPRAELRICLAGPVVTLALALAGGAFALAGSAAGLVLAVVNALALVGCTLPPSRSDAGRAWAAWRLTRRVRTR